MNDAEIIQSFDNEKDKSLKIQLQKVENMERCIVILLSGYIDTYNSTFFQKRITTLIDAGYVQIIFNCTHLDYVSSTGIGSFTVFLKAVKGKGGDVILLSLQPKVYEVFQLLGFANFFTIHDSLETSIEFFKHKDTTVVPQVSIFPKIFACPICAKKLKAPRPGRFRCSECKTILAIDANAQVALG
jgi:anti-anti-sigma factor|nr:STAS domain-containing protein [uncultured Treponema sp.]